MRSCDYNDNIPVPNWQIAPECILFFRLVASWLLASPIFDWVCGMRERMSILTCTQQLMSRDHICHDMTVTPDRQQATSLLHTLCQSSAFRSHPGGAKAEYEPSMPSTPTTRLTTKVSIPQTPNAATSYGNENS
jgi:hypothetical protein